MCVCVCVRACECAAVLRQSFRWLKSQVFPGIPPYTLIIVAIGAGFAALVNSVVSHLITLLLVAGVVMVVVEE